MGGVTRQKICEGGDKVSRARELVIVVEGDGRGVSGCIAVCYPVSPPVYHHHAHRIVAFFLGLVWFFLVPLDSVHTP